MKYIDNFLNKFTMYFVVLWGLRLLIAVALTFSLFGLLPFNPLNFIFSFCYLVLVCFIANKIFSKIFNAPANTESYTISALILFLVLTPIDSIYSLLIFTLAGIVAMGSKYLFAINKRHIFNPAAIALVAIDLIGSPQAEWWIGSKIMFPFVLILGLLIVRKIRKFHLLISFLISAFIAISFFAVLNKSSLLTLLPQVIVSWPILFFGTVMLVEPFTTPPNKKLQMIYGIIVGIFSGSQFNFGPIYSSPELALIIGNIFSYAVSFKQRLVFSFSEKIQISQSVYEFMFTSSKKFNFLPGQYMEWTLAHSKVDSRGNRRFFTLASSPTEEKIQLGIRFESDKSSSFKKKLLDLKASNKIFAGNLSGDFVMPKDISKKLVFIAGGIGITPFRSMIKYLLDKNEKRDIVLFYSNKEKEDIAYKDIFDLAFKNLGIKTVYNLTDVDHIPSEWAGKVGRIDDKMISQEIPDFKDRLFYLSGPHVMVSGYQDLLSKMGIPKKNIIEDFFPGY